MCGAMRRCPAGRPAARQHPYTAIALFKSHTLQSVGRWARGGETNRGGAQPDLHSSDMGHLMRYVPISYLNGNCINIDASGHAVPRSIRIFKMLCVKITQNNMVAKNRFNL